MSEVFCNNKKKSFFLPSISTKAAVFIAFIFFATVFFLPQVFSASGVPTIVSYQGLLTDSSGNTLGGSSGTSYFFKFSIWTTSTIGNGTRLWPTSAPNITTSTVTSGVFSVNIGDTINGYPDTLNLDFFSEQDIYLQVEVASTTGGTYETLSPRQRVGSSGFSINANTVSGRLYTTSTSDYTFNVINDGTGVANLNLIDGDFLTATTTRLTNAGALLNIASLTGSGALTVSSTASGVLTLQSASTTLTLQATASTNASGTVSIANGMLLALGQRTAVPTNLVNGVMYYDTTLNKFRCYENGAITNCVGGTTTINSVTTSTFTFSTTTNYGSFTITTSTDTLTWNFPGRINDINNLATTTGNFIVASGTTWFAKTIGSNGLCLVASSTASAGVSWESCASGGTGLTSLNGLLGATQTFASSGPALSISSAGSTHTFTLATSSASVTGVLSSADWTTFNNKQNSLGSSFVSSTAGTAPIFVSGGTGAVTISLGITAVSSTRAINTTSPLTGGGDLSADRTIALQNASNGQLLIGSSTSWYATTLTGSTYLQVVNTTGTITLNNLGVQTLTGTAPVFVSSATGTPTISLGFTIVSSTRTINTTAPLFGGGDLSADRTFSLGFTIVSSTRAINTGTGLAGGGDLSADRTIYLAAAFATSGTTGLTISSSSATWTFTIATSSATQAGFLQSADWTTFNNKQNSLGSSFVSSTAAGTGIAVSGATGAVTIWNALTFSTSGSSGITIASSSGTWTFSQPTSTASLSGYLSSADWTTFNAKVSALTAGTNITLSSSSNNVTVNVTTTPSFATTTFTGQVVAGESARASSSAAIYVSSTANGTVDIAGILQETTLNPSTGGSFQFGNRHIITVAPSASSSMDGEFIRMIDNSSSLANTVRALELQAWSGTNASGSNTGLWTAGRTFGIQAFSNGTAGGIFKPAAIYGEIDSATQGQALRLYSQTIATSTQDVAEFFQEVSTFRGTGLKMSFAQTGGTFTGDFIRLLRGSTVALNVNATGTLMIGTSTQFSTSTMLLVCAATNCSLPTASNTVAVFASHDSTTAGTSIVAKGSISAAASDFGEYVLIEGQASDYELGDLLSVSTSGDARFRKSSTSSDPMLAGIVTESAAFKAGGEFAGREDALVMTLAGRVPTKVNGEGGAIKPGDPIAASSKSGVGMKAKGVNRVVGVALEAFNSTSSDEIGKVMVFVNPSWYKNDGELLQGGESGDGSINNFTFDESKVTKIDILKANRIYTKRLTVGDEENPSGITLFDVKTKKPYCVMIIDGELKHIPGRCEDISFGSELPEGSDNVLEDIQSREKENATSESIVPEPSIETIIEEFVSDEDPLISEPAVEEGATNNAITEPIVSEAPAPEPPVSEPEFVTEEPPLASEVIPPPTPEPAPELAPEPTL